MGWSDWLPWSRKSSVVYTSVDLLNELLGEASSRTGIAVNAETSLQASVAFACYVRIAEGMSSIPFRLMQRVDRNRGPASGHPLYPMFEWMPNRLQTTVEFFDTVGLHTACEGNAYVWAPRGVTGSILELLPLPPKTVRTDHDWRAGMRYWTTIGGSEQEIPSEQMWHIRGPSWDLAKGLPGVTLAREAIGLALAGERHGASTFTNGARVAGLLTTDQQLAPEVRDKMRESWQKQYAGADNAGKTAVLSHGMKFIEMATSNVDAQWLEGRRFQIEEVCRAFGVLPIMVGYSDKTATYASAAAMFDAHVRYTMLPRYRRIEKSAEVHLLTEGEREDGYYFKFFPNALLRGNAADRASFYSQMATIGALNPNEIRELEDMNPYAGGDEYRVPMNTEQPGQAPAEDGNNAG